MKHFISLSLCITLFINSFTATGKSKEIGSATLDNQMLTIKNDKITLYYDLSHNEIRFSAYTLAGKEKVVFDRPINDLKVTKNSSYTGTPVLSSKTTRIFQGENERFEVSLEYTINHLKIKRIWELHPGLASVKNYYLLKGKTGAEWLENQTKNNVNELIEDVSLLGDSKMIPFFGVVPFNSAHWRASIVSLNDATDHHNNLVKENVFFPYIKASAYSGNVLLLNNSLSNTGIFILKEAPLGKSQQAYPGFDFIIDTKSVLITGLGLSSADIDSEWKKSYAYTVGFTAAKHTEQLIALIDWQKKSRLLKPNRDEMIMSNTWGDRSRDGKMNEKFILQELDAAAKLGITHFQLDDGWQQGLSRNSANKEGQRWDSWAKEDWQPHPTRFPNGLDPVVKKAKKVGIELGLWFNPGSTNHYKNWKENADILIDYYKRYKIKVFKIDGIELPTKESEINLTNFFQYIAEATEGEVVFNMDVTAGRRGGYYYFNEYGNIFLENRYTDWGNYYPHFTLRNLWQLSSYVPVEKLQAEFLNSWRNKDKYPDDDPLAPSKMKWDYLMATTFVAQPLAWMEVSALPEESFAYAKVLKRYKTIQHDFHSGRILPVGQIPDGSSWTGFQSIQAKNGYFLIFREGTNSSKELMAVHLDPGTSVQLTSILGSGESFETTVTDFGQVQFALPNNFNYSLYRYEILEK